MIAPPCLLPVLAACWSLLIVMVGVPGITSSQHHHHHGTPCPSRYAVASHPVPYASPLHTHKDSAGSIPEAFSLPQRGQQQASNTHTNEQGKESKTIIKQLLPTAAPQQW